jgi:uncharacterized protein (DUF697 family)
MIANAPDANVDRLIRRASIFSAALGVVLSPIPLADELILLPVYGVMTARIAKHRGLAASGIPWRPVMATAAAGLAARAAVNVTVSYIPGVAAFANAVSAVALTQFFGRYVDGACQNPTGARAFSMKEILASLRKTRGAHEGEPA